MLKQILNQLRDYLNTHNHFTKLPDEICLLILNQLSPNQLAIASGVCKRFNSLSKHESLSINLKNIQCAFFNKIGTNSKVPPGHFVGNESIHEYAAMSKEELSNILLRLLHRYKNAKKYATKYANSDRSKARSWISSAHFDLMHIVYILEYGVNINMPSSHILVNRNKIQTPFEYAKSIEDKYPELLVLLKEYDNFMANQRQYK